MSYAPIKDIRRQELLEAAFEIIKQHGLQAATLNSIAELAGASKGIVHHYFENKQQLIEQAMRHAHSRRKDDLLKRLSAAQAPSERLWAVISVLLDEKCFQPGFCKAWISFFAETFSDRQLARLHRAIQWRESSNLIHALLPFLSRPEAIRTAIGIRALVEGFRLRLGAVAPSGFDAGVLFDSAVLAGQVLAFVSRKVPGFDQSKAIRF